MGCNCSGSCTCGTPKPFYEDVSFCPVDNTQYVNVSRFYFSMTVPASWNVPEVGASATLIIPGIKDVTVGSFIWHPSFGYFEIVSFDLSREEIMVQNNGDIGVNPNAAPGTQVPECTAFVVTDEPCCNANGNSGDCDFVAVDFTAPAASACIDITVTSAEGLVIGKTVQIGAGRYRLSNVKTSTLITICNDGDGITPGSAVIAKNTAGDFQYCVILLDGNPCTNPAVTTGALLVCADGITQPLDGSIAGSIPVLTDPATNEVTFQLLGIPVKTCTVLTADLTLVNGTAGYTFQVADTSQFTIGDILQIGTRSDRLTVTALPSATFITGTMSPVPSVTVVIPAGTTLCNVDCCELLQDQIDTIGTVILDQCVPEIVIGDVPLAFFITGAGGIAALTLDGEGFYQAEISANLKTLTLPVGSCNYIVRAKISVAVLLSFVAEFPSYTVRNSAGTGTTSFTVPTPTPIYSEVEVHWTPNPYPATRTMGKMVWLENFDDGKDAIGHFPAGSPEATFTQLASPGPDFPLMYHQGDIEAFTQAVGGATRVLKMQFRTLVGDNFPPTAYTEARFMVSGIVEISRV